MQHLKHPRTLDEAFGPHTSHAIYEPPESYPWAWWVCMAAIVLITIATVVAV